MYYLSNKIRKIIEKIYVKKHDRPSRQWSNTHIPMEQRPQRTLKPLQVALLAEFPELRVDGPHQLTVVDARVVILQPILNGFILLLVLCIGQPYNDTMLIRKLRVLLDRQL